MERQHEDLTNIVKGLERSGESLNALMGRLEKFQLLANRLAALEAMPIEPEVPTEAADTQTVTFDAKALMERRVREAVA